VEKILDVASPSQKLAFGLAAYACLRAGEVRGLRWGDVNLEAGIIVVRVSHSHGAISAPKSGHEREIPIAAPLKLFSALRRRRTNWSPRRAKATHGASTASFKPSSARSRRSVSQGGATTI
jgi:integrase